MLLRFQGMMERGPVQSGHAQPSADDAALADRWLKASSFARQAGLRALRKPDGARFEVTLQR